MIRKKYSRLLEAADVRRTQWHRFRTKKLPKPFESKNNAWFKEKFRYIEYDVSPEEMSCLCRSIAVSLGYDPTLGTEIRIYLLCKILRSFERLPDFFFDLMMNLSRLGQGLDHLTCFVAATFFSAPVFLLDARERREDCTSANSSNIYTAIVSPEEVFVPSPPIVVSWSQMSINPIIGHFHGLRREENSPPLTSILSFRLLAFSGSNFRQTTLAENLVLECAEDEKAVLRVAPPSEVDLTAFTSDAGKCSLDEASQEVSS
jgi:hypothetical protein